MKAFSAIKIILSLIFVFSFEPSAFAGSPSWAWDQGSYEQDGTVTMDGEEYAINPTGTQSLTGKSVRQPPTVIVQSSSGGGNPAVLFTPKKMGTFGGDAYCASTFGAGYVMANIGELLYSVRTLPNFGGIWIVNPENPTNNCNNWTAFSQGSSVAFSWSNGSPVMHLYFTNQGCGQEFPVPCVKR